MDFIRQHYYVGSLLWLLWLTKGALTTAVRLLDYQSVLDFCENTFLKINNKT